MPPATSTPRTDVALSCALLAFAALLYWEALKVPPPFFDPLGSAAIPKAVAIVIAVLSGSILYRGLRTLLTAGFPAGAEGYRPRPLFAVGIVVLTAAYAAAMQWDLLGFREATVAFVLCAGAMLGKLNRRSLVVTVALGLILGFGGNALFTQLFYIDLPQ